MKTHHAPEPENTPLRRAIQAVVVGSKSERDLVNRLEQLFNDELQAALDKSDETVTLPAVPGGES